MMATKYFYGAGAVSPTATQLYLSDVSFRSMLLILIDLTAYYLVPSLK
jgi:hypothetical protein